MRRVVAVHLIAQRLQRRTQGHRLGAQAGQVFVLGVRKVCALQCRHVVCHHFGQVCAQLGDLAVQDRVCRRHCACQGLDCIAGRFDCAVVALCQLTCQVSNLFRQGRQATDCFASNKRIANKATRDAGQDRFLADIGAAQISQGQQSARAHLEFNGQANEVQCGVGLQVGGQSRPLRCILQGDDQGSSFRGTEICLSRRNVGHAGVTHRHQVQRHAAWAIGQQGVHGAIAHHQHIGVGGNGAERSQGHLVVVRCIAGDVFG